MPFSEDVAALIARVPRWLTGNARRAPLLNLLPGGPWARVVTAAVLSVLIVLFLSAQQQQPRYNFDLLLFGGNATAYDDDNGTVTAGGARTDGAATVPAVPIDDGPTATVTLAAETTPAAQTAPLSSCELWLNWDTLTLTPSEANRPDCELFLVVDPSNLFEPVTGVQRTGESYGLAKFVSNLDYLQRYAESVASAKIYADQMGYPLYAWIAPGNASAKWERWQHILYPRYHAIQQLLVGDPEHGHPPLLDAVLVSDLDTLHNLTPSPDVSLDRLMAQLPPGKSIVVQAEYDLCACVLVFRRTEFLRNKWLPAYLRECDAGYCVRHSYDQLAFYAILFDTLNGAHGRHLDGNVCRHVGRSRCQIDTFPDLDDPAVATLDWPEFAFVPQTGTAEAPQLQSCMGLWGRCDHNPALVYHYGHTNYAKRGRAETVQQLAKAVHAQRCKRNPARSECTEDS